MSSVMIPTEAIGSIPRSLELMQAYQQYAAGLLSQADLDALALRETIRTIESLEATGSPCVTDGEQRKFSGFASYCLHGAPNVAPDGFDVVFADGHIRHFLPRLTSGPFRYQWYASTFLATAQKYARVPVKQAIVSPSLVSLIYPKQGLPDYPRPQFVHDLMEEHIREVRQCLDQKAHKVQIDFTEGRLSLKLDPSGELLNSFIELLNMGLSHFSVEERQLIGIHTCPGGDIDSTHSAEIDYKDLLPQLFQIEAGNFYIAMAGEKEPRKALRLIKTLLRPQMRVFIGVVNPLTPHIETPEEVRDRVLEAAQFIPVEHLGTTDDCGFSPFVDDRSTSRETAFAKIRARVLGTQLAAEALAASA